MSFDDLIEPHGNGAQEKADPKYAPFMTNRQGSGRIPTFAKPGQAQLFLQAVADGGSLDAACWAIGVSPHMWYSWERKADEGDALYEYFVAQVRQARSAVETEVSAIFLEIVRDIRDDHRAAKDFLERYNPNGWAAATRSKNEVTLDVSDDPQRLLRRLLPEAFTGGAAEEDVQPES